MSAAQVQKWGVLYNADALTIDDMLHFSSLADAAGADSIWTAEGWRDAFVPLTAMAAVAKRVRVGTAIAQMARPPVLTALSALSMAEYTGRRFVLGVGTAPRDWNNNWHGFDVPRPVARIREYIECIRTLWTAAPTAPGPVAITGFPKGLRLISSRNRKFADSPQEGTGFEIPVPRYPW